MRAFRPDRLISLTLGQALARVSKAPRGVGSLPVLMYHSVSEDSEKDTPDYYKLAIAPRQFARQMEWLARRGFEAVSVEEGLRRLSAGECSLRRFVALSFDDGYQDFLTGAWPVLQQYRFSATVYLITGLVSSPRRQFNGRVCLTWDEVRELARQGIEFGSHTVSHPKLYQLPWVEVIEELNSSKRRLEEELGRAVKSFCYPYAFPQEDLQFRGRLQEALRQAQYDHCATTMVGRVQAGGDVFFLSRLPVNSADDERLFSAKMGGAYDWFGALQLGVRKAKSIGRRSRTATLPSPELVKG